MVLITDGTPANSPGPADGGTMPEDNAPLSQAGANSNTRGIKTFVIGSPGSE
jgi:hypothetical protein